MDRLVTFAYERQDVGLEVDDRRLPGRLVGRVQVPAHVADVEFAIRIPQPNGKPMKFVGDHAVP
jgi:hypothetical protein